MSNLNCSIDFVKFIHEVVQCDKDRRPFPDQLKKNPYFSVDLKKVQTIEYLMPALQKNRLACRKSKSGQVYSEYTPQLWFDSINAGNFDQFYQAFNKVAAAKERALKQKASDQQYNLQLSTK